MIEELLITDDLSPRIDQLLKRQFPDYSRAYFQELLDRDEVLLNDKPAKKRHVPKKGDRISISFQPLPEISVEPENIPLDILYEDEHLICVNKPVGMVVHPAPGTYHGTFANALLYHCKNIDKDAFEPSRPGIVHRLDKNTSGVLIAAKTRQSHERLSAQFAERQIEKKYLAICNGRPPEGLFSAPIKRHPVRRQEMQVSEGGKEAISDFSILAAKGNLSLVEIRLITGRTHQIRVHLKHLKSPILGDPVYGSPNINQKYGLSTQALHAHQVRLNHPFSGKSLELIASIPHYMKNFIELLEQAPLK